MLPESKIIGGDARSRAMLLSALYIAQEQYGWLSPEAIQRVADRLNLRPGQVYSTASFYTMFRMQPQGQYRIQVCEGLSCYLVGGAEPFLDHLIKTLNIQPGETTPWAMVGRRGGKRLASIWYWNLFPYSSPQETYPTN